MSMSPLAYADSLRIGTVEFVSPDEIKAVLDVEAPDGVALNTGFPRPFPRVNCYVLIPSDDGHMVGQVEWVAIERSQFPKRQGMRDFGLVDLPYPLRKIKINPLGRLVNESDDANAGCHFHFRRGVEAYPTVGDGVILPKQTQLRAIVESGDNRRITIGTSPFAANAKVMVDPDRLFGRHLAVLGNTGSGKSCSVAGLIRWSLEAAGRERSDANSNPNARFIVLDPNGEYARAFDNACKSDRNDADTQTNHEVRVFAAEQDERKKQLLVPMWLWNSAEWCAFTEASTKAQRPTLIQSLRNVRDVCTDTSPTPSHDMRRYLRTLVRCLIVDRNSGTPWSEFPKPKSFYDRLKKWRVGLQPDSSFTHEEKRTLRAAQENLDGLVASREKQYSEHTFSKVEIERLLLALRNAHSAFGGSDAETTQLDADTPRPFTGDQLLMSIEATSELLGVSEHVETLLIRIRTLLSEARMKVISGTAADMTLDEWLSQYIGSNNASNGSITVIDMSLVPAEIIHIITAVIARMTLEALQRFRKMNRGQTLPTVLVMEEAHTFIKRYKDDAENQTAAATCCQVFEKIAREGRKFGLGLVLSSQRPSELSSTVLSQCNTFLLHRISNDNDQEMVKKLVPDNMRGLLRDLPSLPSRNAILLGWASELPVMVQMKELPDEHRPKSSDPDFWAVWTGKTHDSSIERTANWKEIADDWQKRPRADAAADAPIQTAKGEMCNNSNSESVYSATPF